MVVKPAQVSKQLKKKETGALAAIGKQQQRQLEAAVKIQAAGSTGPSRPSRPSRGAGGTAAAVTGLTGPTAAAAGRRAEDGVGG